MAGILWILFASLLCITEKDNTTHEIVPIPRQGCSGDDWWTDALVISPYTFIHLTGDYPTTEYSWAGRLVCFFMVIAGAGVVSIHSGIIADDFAQIVSEQTAVGTGEGWYDEELDKLEEEYHPAPVEFTSPWLDELQVNFNSLLNGYLGLRQEKPRKRKLPRSPTSKFGYGMSLALILATLPQCSWSPCCRSVSTCRRLSTCLRRSP